MKIIDIHTHGIGGCDTRTDSPEHILKIAELQGVYGVSEILPTICPAPIEEMRANMAAVRKAMEKQVERGKSKVEREIRKADGRGRMSGKDNSKLKTQNLKPFKTSAARISGVHLEGPFLNPSKCGALDAASFLEPIIKNMQRLVEGFEDIVKVITIAPELEGALKLIKKARDMGINVSMGHSDATYAEAQDAFHAGAQGITHIFNAIRGIHHRELGIAGFGLMNKNVYVEIIADPFHLHPDMIRLIFSIKPADKIIIISDSVKSTLSSSIVHRPSSLIPTPSHIFHPPSSLSHHPSPIRTSHGVLSGGSMTVVEAAKRLIGLGIKKEFVMPCISSNPASYLNRG